MDTMITQRQHIIETVKTLPDNSLIELSNFIDYLHYKSTVILRETTDAALMSSTSQPKSTQSNSNFLLKIAALGASKENNISEQVEEILTKEANPVSGWSLH